MEQTLNALNELYRLAFEAEAILDTLYPRQGQNIWDYRVDRMKAQRVVDSIWRQIHAATADLAAVRGQCPGVYNWAGDAARMENKVNYGKSRLAEAQTLALSYEEVK